MLSFVNEVLYEQVLMSLTYLSFEKKFLEKRKEELMYLIHVS